MKCVLQILFQEKESDLDDGNWILNHIRNALAPVQDGTLTHKKSKRMSHISADSGLSQRTQMECS